MAEMVEVAEAGLREASADYEDLVQSDLRKIDEAITRAIDTPSVAADAVKEIFDISHNIKGQAASLDYPLLTEIAQSMCRFISSSGRAVPKRLDMITLHTRAMGTVVAHKIRGEVQETGRKVLEALDIAVEKTLAQDRPK